MQFRASVASALAGLSHSPAWFLVSLAIVFSCRGLPADAAEVAALTWKKVCGGSGSGTACFTSAQIADATGLQVAMGLQVIEPVRPPSIKKLRVIVMIRDPAKSPSLKDTIRISVDSKRFAETPFVFCNATLCAAEKQLSEGDMAVLAGANSLEIEASGKSVDARMGNFAAVVLGRGMTEAESRAEIERENAEVEQKLRKLTEETNKKIRNLGTEQ